MSKESAKIKLSKAEFEEITRIMLEKFRTGKLTLINQYLYKIVNKYGEFFGEELITHCSQQDAYVARFSQRQKEKLSEKYQLWQANLFVGFRSSPLKRILIKKILNEMNIISINGVDRDDCLQQVPEGHAIVSESETNEGYLINISKVNQHLNRGLNNE